MADSTIAGLDKVEAALLQLPSRVEREQVVVNALKAGADVVRRQAQANIRANGSVDTGLLVGGLRIVKLADQQPGQTVVSLRSSAKLSMVVRKGKHKPSRARPSKYAHFVEYGTEHSAARPYMRPAVDEKGAQAVETIRDTALEGIAAQAQKLGLTVR